MKAIRIHEHGNEKVLRTDEIAKPRPGPDEVLVRIKRAALNHLDLWVRRGIPGIHLPLIMGSDAAGVIEAMGSVVENTDELKAGDEVLLAPIRSCGKCAYCISGQENLCSAFQIPGESTNGVQAEYVTLPAKYVFPKPQNLNWDEAAALPLAAMTANHMIIRKAGLQAGQWILIYGASSGVGSAAIQIAKGLGAKVITTVGSVEKEKLAKDLGADFIINYQLDSVGKVARALTDGRGVDVVLEHTGEKTWNDSLRALKKGGKLVTCGATTGPYVKIDLRALFIKHQQLIGSTMGTLQDMREIIELARQGKLKPLISKRFPYDEIQEAHQWLEQGKQFGKVVVDFEN